MKTILFFASAAFVLTTAAAFAGDQFAGMYGNTVHIKRPNGSEAMAYVNADKTWEVHESDGKVYRGTYAWSDDTHFCMTVTDPKPGPEDKPDCNAITGDHKSGDTWTDSGEHGTTTMSITAGR